MARNHRHSTDRVDGQIFAECLNKEYEDDGHLEIVVEYGKAAGDGWMDTFTDIFPECGKCGSDLEYVSYEEPSEVLD